MTRIFTAAAAIAIGLTAAPAAAAPAYLDCVFKDGKGEDFPVNVTVDETNSSVTVFMPRTGFNQRLSGVFRPTEVLFGDRTISYRLDRVTLDMSRTVNLLKSTDTTKCTLLEAPRRAF